MLHELWKGVETWCGLFCSWLNFEDIFIDSRFLLRHMQHWKAKEEWFNLNEPNVRRNEIWHRSRFMELSYYWDRNKETLLPTVCPNCAEFFLLTLYRHMTWVGGEPFSVTCNDCFEEVKISAKTMKGCPLNQAYIIHEDGFNAFT